MSVVSTIFRGIRFHRASSREQQDATQVRRGLRLPPTVSGQRRKTRPAGLRQTKVRSAAVHPVATGQTGHTRQKTQKSLREELDEILVVGPMPTPAKPCPYENIYLRKDRWWGLVREEWLKPDKGIEFTWGSFEKAIGKAKAFHTDITGKYHPNTFVYYGDDAGKQASFGSIHWDIKPGLQPGGGATAPSASDVMGMSHQQTRTDGSNAMYVGGKTEFVTTYMGPMGASTSMYDTSFWELTCRKQDAKGDGTVPTRSGAAPARTAASRIQQQFALTGFGHEASYKNATAQITTLYSITKIAAKARLPA